MCIHIIMKKITLSVLLMNFIFSCGYGSKDVEDPKTVFLTFIANLEKCLLSIFISFSDMFIDVLGINYDSKKEYIGKYFTKIA